MFMKLREVAASAAFGQWLGSCLALNRAVFAFQAAGVRWPCLRANLRGGDCDKRDRKLTAILWRLAAGLVLHGLGEP